MADDQIKLADTLLASIHYDLEQLFYGSEYILEWSVEKRLEAAIGVLEMAKEKLPSIITD